MSIGALYYTIIVVITLDFLLCDWDSKVGPSNDIVIALSVRSWVRSFEYPVQPKPYEEISQFGNLTKHKNERYFDTDKHIA